MPKFLLLSVGLEPATPQWRNGLCDGFVSKWSPVLAPLKGVEIWAFFVVSLYSDFKCIKIFTRNNFQFSITIIRFVILSSVCWVCSLVRNVIIYLLPRS